MKVIKNSKDKGLGGGPQKGRGGGAQKGRCGGLQKAKRHKSLPRNGRINKVKAKSYRAARSALAPAAGIDADSGGIAADEDVGDEGLPTSSRGRRMKRHLHKADQEEKRTEPVKTPGTLALTNQSGKARAASSTMPEDVVFLRILEAKWSHAKADGKKFLETQRYKTRQRNHMKFAKPRALLLFGPKKAAVRAGAAEVAGVAELTGASIQGWCPDIADVLSGVASSLHADLRQYLMGRGHRCYEYVKFSKVFDLRHCGLTWGDLERDVHIRLPANKQGFLRLGGEQVRTALLDLCRSRGVLRHPKDLPEAGLRGLVGGAPAPTDMQEPVAAADMQANAATAEWQPQPLAEGSRGAVLVKGGSLSDRFTIGCGVQIPPLSCTTPERLADDRALVWTVMSAEEGQLVFDIPEADVHEMLSSGDQFAVRRGELYQLRNLSATTPASLKLAIVPDALTASGGDERLRTEEAPQSPVPQISDMMPGRFDPDEDVCSQRPSRSMDATRTPQFRDRLYSPGRLPLERTGRAVSPFGFKRPHEKKSAFPHLL